MNTRISYYQDAVKPTLNRFVHSQHNQPEVPNDPIGILLPFEGPSKTPD